MKHYIPVKGHPGLGRDPETGAIININKSEVENARKRKRALQEKDEEIESLKEDVKTLQDDLSEIKELLKRLVK